MSKVNSANSLGSKELEKMFLDIRDDLTNLFNRSNAVLNGSATYDPPSLVDAAGTTTTVTVTGAALGGIAEASFSLDLQGITLTAWVSAADTVSVRFQNESGGTLDLASGTLRARVTPLANLTAPTALLTT